MSIRAADFFVSPVGGWGNIEGDREPLDEDALAQLLLRPHPDHSDVDVTLALMDLVRDDLHKSGTGGGEQLIDAEMRTAIRTLERVSDRGGYGFKLPFRDHTGWRAWWNRNGGHGSWQARRDLLGTLFDEPTPP